MTEKTQIGWGQQLAVWLNENWKGILYLTIPPIIFMGVSIFFGVATVLAKSDVMKSLIEAEATVLGFFGLITVYFLKSLDDKEDRYVQMLFDLQM